MNNNLSPERRKTVIFACATACLASGPVLLRNHRVLMFACIALQIFFLAAAVLNLNKAAQKDKAEKANQ